jgi:hypothetical protein
MPNFNFVPLITTMIPGHITIDTTILYQHILRRGSMSDRAGSILDDDRKLTVWGEFLNINRKVCISNFLMPQEFKPRGDGAKFSGNISTNGIALSIHLGPQTTKGSTGSKKRARDDAAGMTQFDLRLAAEAKEAGAARYFDEPGVDQDQMHKQNAAFIDPGKRDQLFIVGLQDTAATPQVFPFPLSV